MLIVVILLGSVALFLSACWWLLFNNRFFVEPNKRERLVLQDAITGSMEVIESGAHYRPPWVKQLERVDLNREALHVEDELRTADGAMVKIDYRYDIIVGRHFDPVTGQLQHPVTGALDPLPDDPILVSEEAVILAVTRIDFIDRKERVREIIKGAVEEELGLLKLKGLVSPAAVQGGISLPDLLIENRLVVPQAHVRTSAELYNELAKRVTARVNKRLTFVGINVVGTQVTNIKPSDATQESVEKPLRADYEADAAEQTLRRARAFKKPLSYREALVAEDPAAFGEVTKAEANRSAAKSFSDAIRNGTAAISDGLRNFGKG